METHAEKALASGLGLRLAWRRMERRARAAHDRDVLHLIRELAVAEPTMRRESDPSRTALGSMRFSLTDGQIILAGVSEGSREPVVERVRLAGAGRYGKSWWLRVDSGSGCSTILATRLLLVPGDGGGSRLRVAGPSDLRQPSLA
jgi:hypothetical protein